MSDCEFYETAISDFQHCWFWCLKLKGTEVLEKNGYTMQSLEKFHKIVKYVRRLICMSNFKTMSPFVAF